MTSRIAIVCGHFIPDLGYFEVHLARACSRLGYSVRVITSVKVPSYVEGLTFSNYSAGQELTPAPAYSIERLPVLLTIGQMVFSNGVKKAIKGFDPDLIFVIGLGKVFPKPVFEMPKYRERIYTLLGDNEQSFSSDSLSTYLSRRFLKKPVYKKAIQKSKALFAYTKSTQKIVSEHVGASLAAQLEKKLHQTSLGFDHNVFQFAPEIRQKKRNELGIADEYTWICVSRISPNKDFEPFLKGLAELNGAGHDFEAVFVGADTEGAVMLNGRIEALNIKDKVTILPFVGHQELNALYNAADAAWYPMAAISNFEGLGTGLPILLPDEKNVSHIIKDGIQGSYYQSGSVPGLMNEFTRNSSMDREQNASIAKERFEYRTIVKKILDQCSDTA